MVGIYISYTQEIAQTNMLAIFLNVKVVIFFWYVQVYARLCVIFSIKTKF